MATYAQLKKQIEQLSKQADAARQIEKNATLVKVREAVATFELTPEEVFGTSAKPSKKNASKSAAPKRKPSGAGQAKYRDPKSGAEWSGFGRAPAWLAAAKDRTKFLIAQQPVAEVKPAEKAAVKSAKKAVVKKAVAAPKAKSATKKAAKAEVSVTKTAKAASKPVPSAPKATGKAPAKKAVKVAAKTAPVQATRKTAAVGTPTATAPLPESAPQASSAAV